MNKKLSKRLIQYVVNKAIYIQNKYLSIKHILISSVILEYDILLRSRKYRHLETRLPKYKLQTHTWLCFAAAYKLLR